ncbi:MAG TPA: type II toxin-antitoxin system RelE/ParE family toxin [Longimicrobium sp.]|nr:type II toxin-antitoxin system RelE/ParE family toxin [Longimicrobium sp.]
MKLTVHRLAIRETQKTASAYDKKSLHLGDRFTAEVDRAFARIRENPNIAAQNERGERQLILHRFPYKVIDRVLPDRAVVIAVSHHKRREGYWRRRRNTW